MQIYFHSRLCSYLSRVPILVEGTVNEVSNGTKNTFLLKLCALLLVKLTKMGVTGKPDKTSPTSKRRGLFFTFSALGTHISPW